MPRWLLSTVLTLLIVCLIYYILVLVCILLDGFFSTVKFYVLPLNKDIYLFILPQEEQLKT